MVWAIVVHFYSEGSVGMDVTRDLGRIVDAGVTRSHGWVSLRANALT